MGWKSPKNSQKRRRKIQAPKIPKKTGSFCLTHSGEFVACVTNEHAGLAHSPISNSHTFDELWSSHLTLSISASTVRALQLQGKYYMYWWRIQSFWVKAKKGFEEKRKTVSRNVEETKELISQTRVVSRGKKALK